MNLDAFAMTTYQPCIKPPNFTSSAKNFLSLNLSFALKSYRFLMLAKNLLREPKVNLNNPLISIIMV